MRTPTIVNVLGILIILAATSTASKHMVLKNKIKDGQPVYVVCGSEVSQTVQANQESTVEMLDDPEWTCYGQIGDTMSSRLYYQKYDQSKILGKCMIEAKADGFYRWKEKEKKWEILPTIEKPH